MNEGVRAAQSGVKGAGGLKERERDRQTSVPPDKARPFIFISEAVMALLRDPALHWIR